jgi:predicted transcriptional regulator
MTVKEQVLDVITKMPDDSTLDDIGYRLYVIESVQKGLDELDRGEYLTHDQTREKLQKWLANLRYQAPCVAPAGAG